MSVTGTELVKLRSLSSAQSSIWFAQMLDPRSPIYNIGEYLKILGPIDLQLFETALRQIVAECDALRLRVVETDEAPRQYIDADPDWSMPFFDVSGEADPCAVTKRWMHEDMARVVDLTRGPLFGYALFRAATNLFFDLRDVLTILLGRLSMHFAPSVRHTKQGWRRQLRPSPPYTCTDSPGAWISFLACL